MLKRYLPICFSLLLISACSNNEVNQIQMSQNTQIQSQSKKDIIPTTSKRLLYKVEEIANKWDMSSDLMKVEAKEIDRFGRAKWNYYYDSPFKTPNYLINLHDNKSQEINETLWGREINLRDWLIDSDEAIEIVQKNSNLGTFDFPLESMTLEHRFFEPEWEIKTRFWTYRVNAKTGQYSRLAKK
ncbi:MAG: hypothetical protein U0354_04860 [Candidatus Sericytochromatia bacterium]